MPRNNYVMSKCLMHEIQSINPGTEGPKVPSAGTDLPPASVVPSEAKPSQVKSEQSRAEECLSANACCNLHEIMPPRPYSGARFRIGNGGVRRITKSARVCLKTRCWPCQLRPDQARYGIGACRQSPHPGSPLSMAKSCRGVVSCRGGAAGDTPMDGLRKLGREPCMTGHAFPSGRGVGPKARGEC